MCITLKTLLQTSVKNKECMCITLKTSALESAFAARLDQSLAMKQKISSPLGYTIQRQEDMAMRDHAACVTISP